MDLAHARDTLGGRENALAQRRLVLLRLDVDDHVALRQRTVHGFLDCVRGRMPLPHRRTRGHPDDHVRELLAARLAHAQPAQLYSRLERGDRGEGRLLGLRWHAVHQDVHVQAHQPPGGDEDEAGHEERRGRVGPVVAGPRGEESKQHRCRPGEVAGEVEGVRLQGGAAVALARAIGNGGSDRIHDHHEDDHEEGVPARVDLTVRLPEQPQECLPRDCEAREHEDRRLGQGGQVLGLAVTVGVPQVGRPHRDADGHEGQQRGDQVGAGVRRLGEQAEAAGRYSGHELHRDQHACGDDRDEGGAALRAHARRRIARNKKGPPLASPSAGRCELRS